MRLAKPAVEHPRTQRKTLAAVQNINSSSLATQQDAQILRGTRNGFILYQLDQQEV